MKNPIPSVWQWLGGGKNAVAGNPAALPPILAIPAVPANHWRAGVLVGPFTALVALGIYLLCMGIGSVWKDAGIHIPSLGSSAQAQQTPATNTVTVTEKIIAIPPSDVKDNTIMIKGDNSKGEIHGQVIKVYPNAVVTPPKCTRIPITVGGPGSVVIEITVPIGKSLGFTTPAGVTAEWRDQDGNYSPVTIGEMPNQQGVRFTSVNQKPVQFYLLWSDDY